jgi:hypothetical protein
VAAPLGIVISDVVTGIIHRLDYYH